MAAFHKHRWCPLAREGASRSLCPPDEDRGLAEGCSTPLPNLREVPGSPECWLSLSWSVEAPRWPPETPSSVGSLRPLLPWRPLPRPRPARGQRRVAGCSQRAGVPFVEAVLSCCVLCFCLTGLSSAEASGMFNVSAGRVHGGVGVVRQRWAPLHSGGEGAPVLSQVFTKKTGFKSPSVSTHSGTQPQNQRMPHSKTIAP